MVDLPPSRRFDIPSGVARTAMYMSLVRNHESRRPDALFHDPFSEVVVAELAGTPEMDELAAGFGVAADSFGDVWDKPEFRYFPVRTRYFDDRLIAAMQGDIRQVVSLAAGLDGRPMRLKCPPGTRWYELDLPEMVADDRVRPTRSRDAVWLAGARLPGLRRLINGCRPERGGSRKPLPDLRSGCARAAIPDRLNVLVEDFIRSSGSGLLGRGVGGVGGDGAVGRRPCGGFVRTRGDIGLVPALAAEGHESPALLRHAPRRALLRVHGPAG